MRYEIRGGRNACFDVLSQSMSGESPLVLDVLDCMSMMFLTDGIKHIIKNMDVTSRTSLLAFLNRAELTVCTRDHSRVEREPFVSYDFKKQNIAYSQVSDQASSWLEKFGFVDEVLGILERRGDGAVGVEAIEKLRSARTLNAFLQTAVNNLSTPTGAQRFMKHALEQALSVFNTPTILDNVFVQILALRPNTTSDTQDLVGSVQERVTQAANGLLSLIQMVPILQTMDVSVRKRLVRALDDKLRW